MLKLIDISRPKQWKTLSSKEMLKEGYPVYGANGIIGFYNQYNHKEETICITCRGATSGTINISKPFSYINGNAMALDELDISKIVLKFLYYYLQYRGLKDVITGSAQPQITRESLSKVTIPSYPIEKQKKIAETLDLVSDLIEKRKDQIAEMDKLIQSVYCQINKNETFNTMKVSDVVEKISTGKSYYSEEISTFKVLKTSAVSYGYFDDSQYKNLPREYDPPESTFVKKGDVLVSRMNTEELVGASAYVWKDSDFLTLPDRLWKLHVMENVDPIYLWKTLQQSYFRDSIRRNASGTSGSMKNISQKQFMSLKISIPNILIQKKFASIVEEIESQKKVMKESLHEMENNFHALMQKAFRGELFPDE